MSCGFAFENDIVMKRLLDALRRGNTRANAAHLAGVEPQTVRLWFKACRGKTPNPKVIAAVRRILDAEAYAEDEGVVTVRSGQRGWQSMAWWLERRHSKRWRVDPARHVPAAGANDNGQTLADVPLEDLEAAVNDAITLKKKGA